MSECDFSSMCNQGATSGTERLSKKWQKLQFLYVPLCLTAVWQQDLDPNAGCMRLNVTSKGKFIKDLLIKNKKQNKGISQAGGNNLEKKLENQESKKN